MPRATKQDPLGLRPDPANFGEMLEKVVDARIDYAWRGRTIADLDNLSDATLVLELTARGWAVFRPMGNDT